MMIADKISEFIKGKPVLRPLWAERAVDEIEKKIKTVGMWGTIAFLIQVWERKNPEESRKFYAAKHEAQLNLRSKSGSSKSKTNRYLAEIPTDIMSAVEILFPQVLKYKQEEKVSFMREFARRFPQFAVGKI